jgi:hypothetical protein
VEDVFPGTLMRIQRHILLRPSAVIGLRSLLGGRCKVRLIEGLELEVSRGATLMLRATLGLG